MIKGLIVEDELIIAMDLEARLISIDIDVKDIVSDYDSALKSISLNNPDLIFMDVNIKGEKTGIDIAETLRSKNVNTQIIFLTAFSNQNTLERIETISNCFYLKKPFKDESIKKIITQLKGTL